VTPFSWSSQHNRQRTARMSFHTGLEVSRNANAHPSYRLRSSHHFHLTSLILFDLVSWVEADSLRQIELHGRYAAKRCPFSKWIHKVLYFLACHFFASGASGILKLIVCIPRVIHFLLSGCVECFGKTMNLLSRISFVPPWNQRCGNPLEKSP